MHGVQDSHLKAADSSFGLECESVAESALNARDRAVTAAPSLARSALKELPRVPIVSLASSMTPPRIDRTDRETRNIAGSGAESSDQKNFPLSEAPVQVGWWDGGMGNQRSKL
jgi:hypothetical protein